VNWVVIDDVIRTSYCAIGVAKGNSSLRDFLNLALYEIQSTGKHNEIWESFWGMPPLVKIEADPYF
jgi:polar amino acid transport system substrate-binding protein